MVDSPAGRLPAAIETSFAPTPPRSFDSAAMSSVPPGKPTRGAATRSPAARSLAACPTASMTSSIVTSRRISLAASKSVGVRVVGWPAGAGAVIPSRRSRLAGYAPGEPVTGVHQLERTAGLFVEGEGLRPADEVPDRDQGVVVDGRGAELIDHPVQLGYGADKFLRHPGQPHEQLVCLPRDLGAHGHPAELAGELVQRDVAPDLTGRQSERGRPRRQSELDELVVQRLPDVTVGEGSQREVVGRRDLRVRDAAE